MSNSAIGQFFGAFDPVNWHHHVIGGMDAINKPRANLIQTVLLQKPVQLGLSVVAIASGALAVIREILWALGKFLATPLTLAVGTIRVLTWSHFAESIYSHLPGLDSLVYTARRASLQLAGIVCSALGGALFLANGTRLNVDWQIRLGNYEQVFNEKKLVKEVYCPPPVVIELPPAAPVAAVKPHVQPVTFVPTAVVAPSAVLARPLAQQPAAIIPVAPQAAPQAIIPQPQANRQPPPNPVDPGQWWKNNLAAENKNRIKGWACPSKQLTVPAPLVIQERLAAIQAIELPAAVANRPITFDALHHYIPEKSPKDSKESLRFLKHLAQSRSHLVVTLGDEGEQWWKQCRYVTPLTDSDMTIEWESDAQGYHAAEIFPAKASEGSERIIKRIFTIKQPGQETRRVTQLQYEGWKGAATPETGLFNKLIDLVNPFDAAAPILVQCADGYGRSGAFIAAHWLKHKTNEKEKGDPATVPAVNVEKIILQMRVMRPKMVQEAAYLQAIYQSLALRYNGPSRAAVAAQYVKQTVVAWTPQKVQDYSVRAGNGIVWYTPQRVKNVVNWGLSWFGSGAKPAPVVPPAPADGVTHQIVV